MTVDFDAADTTVTSRRTSVPVLADQIFRTSSIMNVILVIAGALLISISAQVVVPVWPVPVTGQIVGIMIVSFSLGLVRGILATALYLVIGIAGLPVFNNGGAGWQHFVGPTGGYLLGFLLAAAVGGVLAQRGWDRRFRTALAATSLSTVVIYCVGVPWIAAHNGYTFVEAVGNGLFPLLPGAVLKVLFVAVVSSAQWKAIVKYDRMADERDKARRASNLTNY